MSAPGRARARVLVVGVGGIGCPAAWALARAGVATVGLCDDDVVDRSNLHRQVLFADADAQAGAPKVEAAARALRRLSPSTEVRVHPRRLLPAAALELVRDYDVVVEGADNFPTKFLAADACALSGVPVVHASAVRWVATALAVGPRGRPCYRCLFEDVPAGGGASCAEAGVLGPVVGVIAAAQVDLALALLDGGSDAAGHLFTFDGRDGALRRRPVSSRSDCPLCGASARIRRLEPHAYSPPACAG